MSRRICLGDMRYLLPSSNLSAGFRRGWKELVNVEDEFIGCEVLMIKDKGVGLLMEMTVALLPELEVALEGKAPEDKAWEACTRSWEEV